MTNLFRLSILLTLGLTAPAESAALRPETYWVIVEGIPGRRDSIEARKVGSECWLDLTKTALLVGGRLTSTDDKALVNLPLGQMTLTSGSPFVVVNDGRIVQFPMPLVKENSRWWGMGKPVCELLSSLSGDEIALQHQPLLIHFLSGKPSPKLPVPVESTPTLTPPDLKTDRDKWALDVVVIDAGHGGKDPGAVGPTKLKEKEVTLDVALRLDKALREKGIKTVLTRSKDEFIPLAERTSIANRSGGKLFVSLHCNAAKKRDAGGMETYFMAPTKSDRAMEVAMRENEVINYEESRDQYHDLTEENYILLAMAQATFTSESQELAGLMQDQVSKKIGLKNRGVDQAGFYVLIGASMPAVLFEMAFISNKAEEKKLKDKKFRQKLAEEIAESVVGFLKAQGKS